MIITFSNVGRERKSWTLETEKINYNEIYASIKKNSGLTSSGIDFDLDEEFGIGEITAGYKTVGRIEIEKEKTK